MSDVENESGRPALSLVIVVCNEAENITQCIQSASFAEEILVIDSGSRDGTPEIALQLGATVRHQSWLGYGRQKQYAVAQASYDWVLCLDADEYLSPSLAQEIQTTMIQPKYFAFELPRRNYFLGRWLRHGEGYPDWNLRLFNRRYASWSNEAVHEKVHCPQGKIGRLKNDLLHLSEQGLASYVEKQNRYTTLQAELLFQAGRKVHWGHLVFSPIARFIKFYVLRLGFLDGVAGFVHIIVGCFNSFCKYAKVMAHQIGSKK